MRVKNRKPKKRPSGPPQHSLWIGLLVTAATIAVTEPFYPGGYLGDPGLTYFLVVMGVAYWLGLAPALIASVVFTAYITAGSWISGSAFEHTVNNEPRAFFSAILFVGVALAIGLVRARIRREVTAAYDAMQSADEEADLRRQTEVDLKESEELRGLVVESSMDAIVAYDKAGKIISWNRNAEQLFGWTVAEATGMPLQELISPESNFGKLIESRACTKDRRNVDVELYVVPHSSLKGDICIAFVRDITERKAAQEAIYELNASLEQRVRDRTAELESKNEELEGFSYAISHDMRAPLRSIVANARFVLEDEGERVSSAGRGNLERLASAALRMSLLVDDLLQYARLGNQGLQVEGVDLTMLGWSVAKEVGSEYRDAEITVQSGLVAEGDPMLLTLVLNNLIDNACKYSKPAEPAKVHFGATVRDGEKLFFVADQGIGIDMQYAGNLFRPFERLHTQSEYPGTGIGLANVRRIIERHGGRIWLESEAGQGSTFFFTLSQPQHATVAHVA